MSPRFILPDIVDHIGVAMRERERERETEREREAKTYIYIEIDRWRERAIRCINKLRNFYEEKQARLS